MITAIKRLLGIPPRELSVFGRTDTGKVREHNEDSFSILSRRNLFIVADGMGGHNAGEVASRVAIEALVEFFSEQQLHRMRGNKEEIRHSLIAGFRHANNFVMEKASASSKLTGMGCTLVAVIVDKGLLHTCHVGDARCYIKNDQGIEQITTDHTGVTLFQKTTGTGTVENMPSRNVVTMAIGFPFPQDPEYNCNSLKQKDKVLLCSDGLWSMLDDYRINEILTAAPTPEHACDELVLQANAEGGKDNITALVIYY